MCVRVLVRVYVRARVRTFAIEWARMCMRAYVPTRIRVCMGLLVRTCVQLDGHLTQPWSETLALLQLRATTRAGTVACVTTPCTGLTVTVLRDIRGPHVPVSSCSCNEVNIACICLHIKKVHVQQIQLKIQITSHSKTDFLILTYTSLLSQRAYNNLMYDYII